MKPGETPKDVARDDLIEEFGLDPFAVLCLCFKKSLVNPFVKL